MANAMGEAKLTLGPDSPGTLANRVLKLKIKVRTMALIEDHFDVPFSKIETALSDTKAFAKLLQFMAEAAGEKFSDEEAANLRFADVELRDLMDAVYGVSNTPAPEEDGKAASPNGAAPPAAA